MVGLNREVLAAPRYRLPAAAVARVHDALLATLDERAFLFDRRIVEGHGDLRPEHVCLEDARPVIFDRLEFSRRLREVDPADELAFLAMECERLGEPRVGPILFDRYRAATGDAVPAPLRRFYMAHRACIRARLAALHVLELEPSAWPRWLEKAAGYLSLAQAYCAALPG
jgi:aminoglycoside phosphotransferase family enzyme